MSFSEDISRFTNEVSGIINLTFKSIADFIDTVVTFFVSTGFWVSVAVFILLFVLLIMLPLLLFKYWDDILTRYSGMSGKLVNSIIKK